MKSKNMADQILQLNEFFVEGGNQEVSHVLLHITEPSTPEEKEKGYFFAICEINNGDTTFISKLQEMIDKIENNYYEISDEPDRNALEMVLENINQENHALVTNNVNLNCIVGVLRQPEIICSTYGRPHLVLFYKNRQGLYQQLNLLNTDDPSDTNTAPQLFSQIVQGKISAGDYILATTPHVTDYFTIDRLQKIITSREPEESAGHIERVLGDLKEGMSFGGLIIHTTPHENSALVVKSKPFKKGDSRASLTSLFAREKNTASTLSPSLFGRLSDKIKPYVETKYETQQAAQNTLTEKKIPTPTARIKSSHIFQHRSTPNKHNPIFTKENTQIVLSLTARFLKTMVSWLWWLIVFVSTVAQGVVQIIGLFLIIITNYRGRRRTVIEEWKRVWRNYRENLRSLSLTTKIVTSGAVLIAMFFVGSIMYLRAAEKKRVATERYNAAIQAIKAKRDEADSSLVYHNEPAALLALGDAKNILGTISCVSKLEKETCNKLGAQIEDLLTKVRKLTIATPELLVSWPDVSLTELLKINTTLLAFSNSSSSVVAFNLLTKESKKINIPGSSGFVNGTVPKENDYALLLSTSGALWQLNLDELNIKNIDLSYPTNTAKPSATMIYNRRLYSLDPANNQIYKHDSIKTGFGQGKNWLISNSTDLSESSKMAIDGDVFVLKKNGQIAKFSNGETQSFIIQGLDPVFSGNGTIWTYNDASYIYILDSTNKRLIVLNKDGSLDRQITATEFINPTGMVIDEINNLAFILDKGKLYRIVLK